MRITRKSTSVIVFLILLLSIVCFCLPVFAAEGEGGEDELYDGYIVKLTDNAPASVSLMAEDEGACEVADGYYVVESLEAAEAIADERYIEYMEPNYYLTLFEYPEDTDDPYYSLQSAYLDLIDAQAAWGEGYVGDGVTVAVIDTGIVLGHEDLDYTNINSSLGARFNADGSTQIGAAYVGDSKGHGTFVSGIIAAQTDNAKGIAGMTEEVTILPLKCFTNPDKNETTVAQIVAAIDYAIDKDVDVINLSLGGSVNPSPLAAICQEAADDGIILIASAGNDGTTDYCYPASYDCVISVGSVNSAGTVSSFSQRNSQVFVTAPGEDIRSLWYTTTTSYISGDGTSFSAPIVAAMAAIAKEYDKDIDVYDMMTLLEASAVDDTAFPGRDTYYPGKDNSYGYGIVNVADFITELEGEHDIIYNLNDGVLDMEADDYVDSFTTNETPVTLSTPTRLGYDFGGWYENASFTGSVVTEVPAGTVEDYTVYAKWYDKAEIRVSYTSVSGYAASLEDGTDDTYQVLLPADTGVTVGDIEITPEDDSADVSTPVTSDSGATWTFTVTSGAHPEYHKTYTLNVTISDDHTPVVVSETQTGTATPASSSGDISAVPYSEDISTWFTDEDGDDTLTYEVVSENAAGSAAIVGSTLTYTPAANDAGKTITIVVKANDGVFDSPNVTLKVTVGSLPQNVGDSTLSISSASFDLNEASEGYADITLALTLNGHTLDTVLINGEALSIDDYTVSVSDVTIKKEYLSGFSTGQTTLIFDFSTGNDASLTIAVSNSFVAVDKIMLASSSVTVGESLTLAGTVTPADATNQTIAWSLKSAGGTGASVEGNTFTATSAGTAIVTATITNGKDAKTDYSKDFSITVKAAAPAGGGGGGGAAIDDTTYVKLFFGGSSVEVPYTMSGGQIVLDIDATTLRKLLKNMLTNSALTMDFSGMEGGVSLTIPSPAFKVLQDEAKSGFSLKMPGAELLFSREAMAAIVDQANGGEITVLAAQLAASRLSVAQKAVVGDRPVYDLSVKYGNTVISDLGGSVTISLSYTLQSGEKADGVVIWYLDAKGELTAVPATYDQNSGRVTFTVSHFSYYVVGYDPAKVWQNPFTDVAEGAWYYNAVQYCSQNQITNGIKPNLFGPDEGLTRGQFMVLLMRAYGLGAQANPVDNFTDAGDTYYTSYLAAAKTLGIAGGVGDNQFAPEAKITRQEMFTLLYRVLGLLDKLPQQDPGAALADYTDADTIADFAKGSMEALVSRGVVSGNEGRLDPKGFTTRAQMAQVLYNLLSK